MLIYTYTYNFSRGSHPMCEFARVWDGGKQKDDSDIYIYIGMHIYMYSYMHTYIYTYIKMNSHVAATQCANSLAFGMVADRNTTQTYTCIYIGMHIYVYSYKHTHIYIYINEFSRGGDQM